jgi:hypothetical protein
VKEGSRPLPWEGFQWMVGCSVIGGFLNDWQSYRDGRKIAFVTCCWQHSSGEWPLAQRLG